MGGGDGVPPYPDLAWGTPPPPKTWDRVPPPPRKCEQTENITFPNTSDAGGNKMALTFIYWLRWIFQGVCDYIMAEKLGNLKDTMKSEDTAQTNTPKYPEEIKVNFACIWDIFYANKFSQDN